MRIEVVPVAEEHIESLNASLDCVARERRYISFLEGPPLEESAAFVRNNIEHGYPQFVALDGRTVVGWCDVIPMQRAVYAHRGVLGMGVLPSYRGRGIGRRLVVAALAAARALGLTRTDLEVRENNAAARALYLSVGFVVEGAKRGAMRVDGEDFNVVSMALLYERMA